MPPVISYQIPTGNEALVELGVKTGLSLLFSLLRQNWTLAEQCGQLSLCNDVFRTAISVVLSLPPLSLANETKMTSLGVDSLNEITKFLCAAANPSSGADISGQQLASDLMISLATQRGSLRYLLEWIQLSLDVSTTAQLEQKRGNQAGQGMLRWSFFERVLQSMMKSAVSLVECNHFAQERKDIFGIRDVAESFRFHPTLIVLFLKQIELYYKF